MTCVSGINEERGSVFIKSILICVYFIDKNDAKFTFHINTVLLYC